MVKQNKKTFFEPEQHGGMLMELMLSVALAAIIIPFVFRYQQNVVERARNIAIIKQMDIVRDALEKCVFENRPKILVQGISVFTEDNTPPDIDCLTLTGLVKYGLAPEFAKDFEKDYKLRILKSSDYTDQPVLQGVVLLTNQDINAVRTREIVKLAGDKIGFLDGENIQGGYNTFKTNKKDFAMVKMNDGIVRTTDTMRGYSKYLWRLPSESEEDATMLSDLNLDGHDIVGLDKIFAYGAYFSSGLQVGLDPENDKMFIDVTNLEFPNFSKIQAVCYADSADVNADLVSLKEFGLSIAGKQSKLTLRGLSNFDTCNTPVFTVNNDLVLSTANADSKELTVKGNIILDSIDKTGIVSVGIKSDGKGSMSGAEVGVEEDCDLDDENCEQDGGEPGTPYSSNKNSYVFTPRFVTKEIRPLFDETKKYYWIDNGKQREVSFKDVRLIGRTGRDSLSSKLQAFKASDGKFNNNKGGDVANTEYVLYAEHYFSNEKMTNMSDILVALGNTKKMVDRKYSLLDVCTHDKYSDPYSANKIRYYCVNDGAPYLPLDKDNCGKISDDTCLDDYVHIMQTCATYYGLSPNPAPGFSESEYFKDRYNSVYVDNNFLMCWSCRDYIGQRDKEGRKYVKDCTRCAQIIAENPKAYGGNLAACVSEQHDKPK